MYFFHLAKCCAQGTRTGMNSSTNPCPSRKEANLWFTKRQIRAAGKFRRRFLKNEVTIARSPKFQYSMIRMLFGTSSRCCTRPGAGRRGKISFSQLSNRRTSIHFRGGIFKKVARAALSAEIAVWDATPNPSLPFSVGGELVSLTRFTVFRPSSLQVGYQSQI